MLISPSNTFQSCGSSSIFVSRRTLPTLVIRVSPPTVTRGPALWTRMDLNFRIRKRVNLRPTRSCRNKIGSPESSQMARVAPARIGLVSTSKKQLRAISMKRFNAVNVNPSRWRLQGLRRYFGVASKRWTG